MKKIKRTKKGIKIACENEEEASKIKETITEKTEESEDITVKTASIRKKKVIIFNVPEHITEEQIKQKIGKKKNNGPAVLQMTQSLCSGMRWLAGEAINRSFSLNHWQITCLRQERSAWG